MAGRIPERFIEELLERADLIEVIDARVPLKKAGKDYKACCPFHDEKTPSFTVSPDKQFYHCFGCGAHGSAIGFLMQYERMSFLEAVEELAAAVGLEVPREAGAVHRPDDLSPLLDILQKADRYFRRQLREHPRAQEAVDYLKGRGLSGEICADFGLGLAPDGWDNLLKAIGREPQAQQALVRAGLIVQKEGGGYYDRFRNRIMFPIHDYRGRLIGFGGRVIAQGEPKYLNSPETPLFHKGRELYGLYRAREPLKRENRVLVVEGYMDVVALAQFGIDYAVATLGTATTREHLERLFRFVPEAVFCFDGDRAGREAAWRALENALPALHEGRQVSFLFLPEGEDPDSLVRKEGREAFSARLANAQPLPDYFFQVLSAQVDLTRLDGRARLVELARPHLSKIPQGVLRQLMAERLAEISRLATAKLTPLLNLGEGPATRRQAAPPGRPAGKSAPSLVRTAVALLVQHPELAQSVQDPAEFKALERPGMALFTDLLELLKRQPGLKTGVIIEHYRDSEHQQHLAKLAVWDHPAFNQDIDPEFQDLLGQFRREIRRQKADQLCHKERLVGLSPGEKAELRELLSDRH